ncbi:uncharacterized protein C8Q71DRAFT_390955 [Rhodofomes roseus]|uniref:Uncharacterized protein n=1 Tax=Rhodofomes roseus TaxID=34475 RepID=A0ABQ8JZS5_9APHY|nr:uncharacterized protein C8Q71DRAFT_390955 [Rhodofomes roseus]KAH9829851.1 hypothetical protein C8Q71DRAFT_390955 [Rhodofomes roseus]
MIRHHIPRMMDSKDTTSILNAGRSPIDPMAMITTSLIPGTSSPSRLRYLVRRLQRSKVGRRAPERSRPCREAHWERTRDCLRAFWTGSLQFLHRSKQYTNDAPVRRPNSKPSGSLPIARQFVIRPNPRTPSVPVRNRARQFLPVHTLYSSCDIVHDVPRSCPGVAFRDDWYVNHRRWVQRPRAASRWACYQPATNRLSQPCTHIVPAGRCTLTTALVREWS